MYLVIKSLTDLRTLQHRFLEYLRNENVDIAANIAAENDVERDRRLSIYFNAYRIRLRGSMEIDHPVLATYLGDMGFERMAAMYIDQHPSTETSLRHFCNLLPRFLATEELFADIGVLADLATFERLLMDVFDAADMDTIDREFIQSIPSTSWPDLVLQFHPSVRQFETNWNCVQIWQSIKAAREPPAVSDIDHHLWLLWRNQERLTEFRSTSIDEYVLLDAAMRGENFAKLCELLLEWFDEADVATRAIALLNGWIDSGIIGNFETPHLSAR